MSVAKQTQMDPLYIIFEEHLYNFQDSELDRKTFIRNVLKDYVQHLRSLKIIVPKSLEEPIIEELSVQVQQMLVKKIYGFISLKDYQKQLPAKKKRNAKTKYSQLKKKLHL